MKKYLLIFAIIFLMPVIACALGPKIVKHNAVWDANIEPDLAGYYLYWRTQAGTFSDVNKVTVGIGANPLFDLLTLNLSPGQYSIAVSAFDTEDNESGLSEEASWDASYPGNPNKPRITP